MGSLNRNREFKFALICFALVTQPILVFPRSLMKMFDEQTGEKNNQTRYLEDIKIYIYCAVVGCFVSTFVVYWTNQCKKVLIGLITTSLIGFIIFDYGLH